MRQKNEGFDCFGTPNVFVPQGAILREFFATLGRIFFLSCEPKKKVTSLSLSLVQPQLVF